MGEGPHWQEHRVVAGQTHRPHCQPSLRSSWCSQLQDQASGQGQGTQVRTRQRSPVIQRIQEVKTSSLLWFIVCYVSVGGLLALRKSRPSVPVTTPIISEERNTPFNAPKKKKKKKKKKS